MPVSESPASAFQARQRDADDTTRIMTRASLQESLPSPVIVRDRCTLTLLAGPNVGRIVAVPAEGLVVGRGGDADLRIDDAGLSRCHARLFRMGDGTYVQDLGSTNGSWVDGAPVRGAVLVSDGSRVALGPNTLFGAQIQDIAEQETTLQLYESTIRDGLTRVYNRRYLDRRMAEEVAYSLRHHAALSVLILDVDHFKHVNDTFGHAAGDAVLRVLAATVSRLVRTEDVVARYGGEEFCVVARGIDARNAAIFGERLRRTVESMRAPVGERSLSVTISVGVSTLDGETTYADAAALLGAADAALYRAKATGRNRVVSAGGSS